MRSICLQSNLNQKYGSRCTRKNPYYILTGSKPYLSNLSIFGSKVKVLKPKPYRKSKVDSKVWDRFHVGYAPGDFYRIFVPSLNPVIESIGVTFMERLYRNPGKTEIETLSSNQSETNNDEVDEDSSDEEDGVENPNDNESNEVGEHSGSDEEGEYVPPWKVNPRGKAGSLNIESFSNENEGTRTSSGISSVPPKRFDGRAQLEFMTAEAMNGNVSDDLPSSSYDACSRIDKSKWIASMSEEICSMIDNRYKSRLVAKGYSQVHGIDYQDEFAPVVKAETIRFPLAYVDRKDMEMQQVDVKTAFFYGDLDEYIYI